MGRSVIEVDGVVAGYGAKPVLKGIHTSFPAGRISCIVGGSGCGKSTLLKTFVGLLRPTEGRVLVLGEDAGQLEDEALADLLSRVGLMFQYGALLGSLTIRENLAIPLRAHTTLPEAVIQDLIAMKLDLVELGPAIDQLPSELSGGMRKRAGLARSTMLDPPLLLADEPSAGLDPITMARLDQLLLKFKSMLRMSMVIVTHELHSIRTIADRIVMLHDGMVRFDGTLEEALASADPVVADFFARRAEERSATRRSIYDAVTTGVGG